MITLLAALILGAPSPNMLNIPNPIGPEPNPGATPCVFIIPIATPGHWMCPEGFNAPEGTP